MGTLRDFTLLTALALAGTAYAQAPAPDQTPQPASPSTPGQVSPGRQNPDPGSLQTQPAQSAMPGQSYPRAQPGQDVSPTTPGETSPNSSAAPAPGASSSASVNANPGAAATTRREDRTRLASASGVTSGMAVQSESGHPLGFVVDVVPGTGGMQENGYVVIAGAAGTGTTPVPYSTASSMVRDGKLVINRGRFDHAPKVQQSDIQNTAAWKDKTDHYWSQEPGSHHMMRQERMSSEAQSSSDMGNMGEEQTVPR